MAALTNLTNNAAINVAVRELDFVTSFAKNWEALREIMGISRPIRKAPGTALKVKTASITLQSGAVTEGDEIPLSKATVAETTIGTISLKKYRKATSIEAIIEKGYDNAVGLTDQALKDELTGIVLSDFYTFLTTKGTLTKSYVGFQLALAMAKGEVENKFKGMNTSITDVVAFVNILDFYKYLGTANITVQSKFGMTYVKDFMGYSVVFLCASNQVAQNKIYATPVNNLVLYYVDPSDEELAKAGMVFTTAGTETNLVGFHTEGDYTRMSSECFALMGMGLFAEYLDGIASITVTAPSAS